MRASVPCAFTDALRETPARGSPTARGWTSLRDMKLFGRKGGDGAQADPAEAYLGLRRLALGLTAGSLGSGCPADAPVVALLMESGMSGAVATLVGVADGTTSLYYSTGGGVIGAGTRRGVSAATDHWLQTCGALLEHLSPIHDAALPGEGVTQFVAVTPGGLLGAGAPMADLGERRHVLSPLFYAGHDVISRIRLTQAA